VIVLLEPLSVVNLGVDDYIDRSGQGLFWFYGI